MTKRRYRCKSVRLAEALAGDIGNGTYGAGVMLPPETALAERFGMSRLTVRRALDFLAEEGVVQRLRYRGVQVMPEGDGHGHAPAVLSGTGSSRRGTGVSTQRRRFAAVMGSQPDEGLVLIQEGLERYTQENGFELKLLTFDTARTQAFDMLRDVEHFDADGIIVLPHAGPEPVDLLEELVRQGIPVVCVEKRTDREPLPSVEPDSASGMYRAVNYLIRRYQRPVFFAGLRFDHRTDAQRYEGYVCAMRDAGFGDRIEAMTYLHPVSTGDPAYWREERKWLHGYEVAQGLLAEQEPPISVACLKDYVAWGVYKAADEAGWGVGSDLAVTGFDDLTIAQLLEPALTTVHQDMREKGYQAAQLLDMRIVQGTMHPVTVTLPVKLVIRGSA